MDHKLKLMVVDDSPLFRTWLIRSLSEDDRFQVVGYAINAFDAQEKIPKLQPDMLTLDIEMPGTDGMELAKEIRDGLPAAGIIFITSHLEYAVAAYEYAVFRLYLQKYAGGKGFPAALEDFYKLYELERSSYYRIQVKSHVEQLPFRDILYILKEGKYAVFHLRSGRTASVRRSLSQVYGEIGQEYFYLQTAAASSIWRT